MSRTSVRRRVLASAAALIATVSLAGVATIGTSSSVMAGGCCRSSV